MLKKSLFYEPEMNEEYFFFFFSHVCGDEDGGN